jgi:hypothetical protein
MSSMRRFLPVLCSLGEHAVVWGPSQRFPAILKFSVGLMPPERQSVGCGGFQLSSRYSKFVLSLLGLEAACAVFDASQTLPPS